MYIVHSEDECLQVSILNYCRVLKPTQSVAFATQRTISKYAFRKCVFLSARGTMY